jgi:hypothetical protein
MLEDIKDRIDIVLSPKFYWVKLEKMTLKKERDAVKFAPSIFEGQFQSLESYRFLAIKRSDDEYIFIAYNPLQIVQKLRDDYHIAEKFIGDIYTAQSEFVDIEEPLSVNRKKMVISIDGVVSEVPRHSFDDSINYVDSFLKKGERKGYSLKVKGADGSGSTLFVASILPLAVITYLALDIVKLGSDIEYLQSEIERRQKAYKLPSTSFQTESIKKRYQNIEMEQDRLRSSLFWLQENKFNKYGKIEFLAVDHREFKFKLDVQKGKSLNTIKSNLQKRDKMVQFSENGSILEVSFRE